MSTLVDFTSGLVDANAGAVCCYRPLQQQQRGLCLGSTSPQQLTICAIPSGLVRGRVRALKLTRSLQGGPRADSETEERPRRTEGNGRGGLDELDSQLRSLSASDNPASAAREAREASQGNVEELPREENKKVEWPIFGDGFVVYISVGLILLTIINNILFKIFLGPPVPKFSPIEETEPSQESQEFKVRRERYKLRSYNDPKYLQRAQQVTEEPLS